MITTFEELQEYLSDIPAINYGGCGISALVMQAWLRENKDIQVNIVYAYYPNAGNIERNEALLKGKGRTGGGPTHAFIEFSDGTYQDCSGEIDIESRGYYKTQILPPHIVVKTLYPKSRWNESFDRKRYVPEIEAKTGIKLNLKLK